MNKENDLIMPKHIAMVLDGNRRWAKEKGMPTLKGHQKGFENIRDLTPYIFNRGVEVLSVYAFSEQNFNRSEDEVNYLMDIFVNMFKNECEKIHNENIRIVFSGRRNRLRKDVVDAMNEITERTKNNTKGTFNVCLGYSGQQEVCDMTKKLCEMYKEGKIELDEITPEFVQTQLYQDLPPVDLMIRTSGEIRLSNFLPWQLVYSEFYFTNKYWPDFNEKDLDEAIKEYQKRNRKFGGK